MKLSDLEPWRLDASCREVAEDFFPVLASTRPHHRRDYDRRVAKCKAICRVCPVQADCLESAMVNEEQGIWGGTVEDEREEIRRARERTREREKKRRQRAYAYTG